MRLYRCTNRAGTGSWIMAADEAQAKTLFVAIGRATTVSHVSIVDVTDAYTNEEGQPETSDSLNTLLANGTAAELVIELPEITWDDVMTGRNLITNGRIWRAVSIKLP